MSSCPLPTTGAPFAALLFARETAWTDPETTLGEALAETAAHAWLALRPRSKMLSRRPRARIMATAAALLALALCIPAPLTALAPAEVVGRQPVVVSAPIDGVVASLPVAPNARVNEGDVVMTFVDTRLRNDAEIAERSQAVAAAKLHRMVQSAFGAPKDAHEIAIARAELDLAEAEARRARDLLDRTVVRASRAGVLVYSAPEDWLGKPLSTGERVMDIVDPQSVELRIDLAIADVLALRSGAAVTFYPDGDPLDKHEARIDRIGYRATPVAEGQLVYRNYGAFETGASARLRVGVRGTAKLYGESVPLIFYLVRRPLAAIRQQVGL